MTIQLTPLTMIGAGGFGREVLEIVRDINGAALTFDFLGFLDDGEVDAQLLQRLGAPLLGPSSRLADLAARYVIGIGTVEPRRRIDALVRSWGRTAATLTHPSATIGSTAASSRPVTRSWTRALAAASSPSIDRRDRRSGPRGRSPLRRAVVGRRELTAVPIGRS